MRNSGPITAAAVSACATAGWSGSRRRRIVARTPSGTGSRPDASASGAASAPSDASRRMTSSTNSGLPPVSACRRSTSCSGPASDGCGAASSRTSSRERPPSTRRRPVLPRSASAAASSASRPRLAGAVGGDGEDVSAVKAAREELEQAHRGHVGGVQVVEHDHDRPARRRGADERGRGVERAEARRLGVERRARGSAVVGQPLTDLGRDLRDVGRAGDRGPRPTSSAGRSRRSSRITWVQGQ